VVWIMAKCVKCGSETQLYVNDSPICVTCDSGKAKAAVASTNLEQARAKWKAAQQEFEIAEAVYVDLAGDNPDGSRALKNANRLLAEAGAEYREALREFVTGKSPQR